MVSGFYARARRKKRVKNGKRAIRFAAPLSELGFRQGVRDRRLRFSCRGHQAPALRRRIAKSCAEAARFPDARAQSINHRRNRVVRNSTDEKNDKRCFSRSVGAGTDAYSLHAGPLHPFIHVCSVHDFRARHFRIGDQIDELRRCSSLLERRTLRGLLQRCECVCPQPAQANCCAAVPWSQKAKWQVRWNCRNSFPGRRPAVQDAPSTLRHAHPAR